MLNATVGINGLNFFGLSYTQKIGLSESCSSKPNLDCNYHFPIDLAPNEIPIGAKSIGKCNYNPNLVWINTIPKIIFDVYSVRYVAPPPPPILRLEGLEYSKT